MDNRRKYRIRLYNGSADRLQLEIKRKRHGMTQKLSCLLTREQCEAPDARALPAVSRAAGSPSAEGALGSIRRPAPEGAKGSRSGAAPFGGGAGGRPAAGGCASCA